MSATTVSKSKKITTWILVGLVSLLVIMSSIVKLISPSDSEPAKNFIKWGLENKLVIIGVFELLSGLLFLYSKTSSLGVLLLTAYFGGAVATHIEHGEVTMSITPILIILLTWASAYVRNPEIFSSFKSK